MLGALLVSFLATRAGPSSADWLFQSPVSPISPISPLAPGPTASPAVPVATATGPALVAVPVPPNFTPWLVGIILVAAVVVAAMWWNRRGERGPDA
jgi:hypothetical protein